MNELIKIIDARMEYSKEEGYVGQVEFEVEQDNNTYEITLQSKRGKDWGYSLHFTTKSGSEEELFAVEELIEDNDEIYDLLIDTAKSKLES